MNKLILLLHGPKYVGKSTLAGEIQKFCPGVLRVSFADPIKDAIETIFGIKAKDVVDKEAILDIPWLHDLSYRDLCIELGQWGRDVISKDIWAQAAVNKIRRSTATTIVIDDCRFDNEANVIRQAFPNVRTKVVGLVRYGVDFVGGATETPLETVDHTLYLGGSTFEKMWLELDALRKP